MLNYFCNPDMLVKNFAVPYPYPYKGYDEFSVSVFFETLSLPWMSCRNI